MISQIRAFLLEQDIAARVAHPSQLALPDIGEPKERDLTANGQPDPRGRGHAER
jgi:hypothetical protein